MKTLVKIPENVSLYLFANDKPVVIGGDVIVGEPVEFIISDCDAGNSVMYENVTAPNDWAGCKYLFDGTNWTLNPGYIPPKPIPVQE